MGNLGTSLDSIREQIDNTRRMIPPMSVWTHRKNTSVKYTVRDLAILQIDCQHDTDVVVIYSNLGVTWVRPSSEFLERFVRVSA